MQQQDDPEASELQQQPPATPIADTPQIVQRPEECGVCLLVYDELDRRPRTLPCGHTYCSLCVTVLLEDGHLICPSCRIDHCAPEVNHFPISYALEAVVKVMRTQKIVIPSQASEELLQATGEVPQLTPKGSEVTEAKTKRRVTAGLSRKLRTMIQEQKRSIESLETTLQKELDQLVLYRNKLVVSRVEHAHLQKELDKLVQQHQVNMDQLQEEDVRVESFVEEGKEAQKELRASQGQLDQVNTAQEAFTTIDAADHTVVEVEEWLQHSREEIPNGTVLNTSFMMLEATKAAVKVITAETGATPDLATSGHMNCTVMEAVTNIEGGPVELSDLGSKKLRKKFKAGWVFAIQKYADGTYYSSKMICKENRVYMHALKDKSPPQMAFTLEVSKALQNLDYLSISVFLDLAWPGTASLRIYIQLVADNPLTRQFVSLCLGHNGLTYCNTNLMNVQNNGYKRIVWGGDISGHNALANQILPPIQSNQCGNRVHVQSGMVVACADLSNVGTRTRFGIVIDGNNGYSSQPMYHLGSVKDDGRKDVERAVNSGNLTSVKVVDCGVVC